MLCFPKNLTNLTDPEINEFPDLYEVPEENENPQRRYQFNSQDSLLVQNTHLLKKIILRQVREEALTHC